MVKLFSPYTIRNVELKNRIVFSPIGTSAATENGVLTDLQYAHYVARAIGDVGLIVVESTAVSSDARATFPGLGLWNEEQKSVLKKLTTTIKQTGAKTAIQLSHNGRKRQITGKIYAPSSIPFDDTYQVPEELTKEQITNIVEDFRKSAVLAQQAGFDIIEIHAAHGYLINQFLSPLTNARQDEYDGTTENRYRFLKEIVEAIRTVFEGPLFVRISAKDYDPEGLNVEDYVVYAKWLHEQGVDLIDVSSGGVVPADYHVYPGYQVPLSDKIRNEAHVPTGAVGLITSGLQAEEILQNHRADLIFIGRKLLENPYWPIQAARELGIVKSYPVLFEFANNK